MSPARPPELGDPCLAGFASSDPARATRFYESVLAWRTRTVDGIALMGVRETDFAVVYPQTRRARAAGVAPHWTPLITVSDADSALASAVALGALALREPFDAAAGRIAPIRDPTGATVSLWEAPPRADGVRLGASQDACSHELMTEDLARARRFYAELFSWRYHAGGPGRTTITLAGQAIGAMREPGASDSRPPGWIPAFAVADVGAATRMVKRLGGQRLGRASPGQSALLRDPDGAVFALFRGP